MEEKKVHPQCVAGAAASPAQPRGRGGQKTFRGNDSDDDYDEDVKRAVLSLALKLELLRVIVQHTQEGDASRKGNTR